VLVFTRTKPGADRVVRHLEREGVAATAMHGDKSQAQREKALARFEDGRVPTLIATDVAARGIDVEGVTHVINYSCPEDEKTYVHRIGRTGRAFAEGKAITLVTAAEEYHIRKIEKVIREKIPVRTLPSDVPIEETSYKERQDMAREIDAQKRREDPEFKGAFHEKKRARK